MENFKDESKIQIEALVSEYNLLGRQLGEETLERASKMLKAYVKLGYQVPSPDLAQLTTYEDIQNAIPFLNNLKEQLQIQTGEASKIEPVIAKAMSMCYNRLQTIKDKSFQINIKELADLRQKIISGNCEKELKEKYEERIQYSKELYGEMKLLLDWLNAYIKVGEDLLRL